MLSSSRLGIERASEQSQFTPKSISFPATLQFFCLFDQHQFSLQLERQQRCPRENETVFRKKKKCTHSGHSRAGESNDELKPSVPQSEGSRISQHATPAFVSQLAPLWIVFKGKRCRWSKSTSKESSFFPPRSNQRKNLR